MTFEFKPASKAIFNITDFEGFQKSATCAEILNFIKACAEAVVDCSIADEITVPDAVTKFGCFMQKLYNLIDEVPPLKQPMRFGNKAFRTWHDRMTSEANTFLCETIPEDKSGAVAELAPYILDMFGNTTRIDYGTGHELNFALLFCALLKLGVIEVADLKAVVLRGFVEYLRTMRRLQVEYMLEPAGSHGVWGLDDYHCLLFVWGAAQLVTRPTSASPPKDTAVKASSEGTTESTDAPQTVFYVAPVREPHRITPSSIHNRQVLSEYSSEYLYLEGISFICKIKSAAPFPETSPMLNDISGMNDWNKVCSGLMKLFQGEVLYKFPVAQHILFGSILPCTWK